MFNTKRSNVIILLLFNFYQLKKVTPPNVYFDYLSPIELYEKKKVTISSNLPIFFRLIIFLKTILLHQFIDFFKFRSHVQVIVNSIKTL